MRSDSATAVIEVRAHSESYFTLVSSAPPAYRDLAAGQFVMLQVAPGMDPFLRRPFSILDVSDRGGELAIEIIFKIVGAGTALMARKRPGDSLTVLGPLGKPFRADAAAAGERVAVVAGGIGCAPFLLLGRALAARGIVADFYYGGRGAEDLARWEDFAGVYGSEHTFLATEDGSLGARGRITAPLAPRLAGGEYRYVYACGPTPMLAAVAGLCAEHGVAGEASLESPMGCGFGTCMGCVVPHRDGRYATVCVEGTVFRFDEIRWAEMTGIGAHAPASITGQK